MKELNSHKVGLALGVLIGGMHLLWSMLVAFGMAQPIMDWIFGLHMLNNPFQVAPFNIGTAGMLVAFTFIVGYVIGWMFSMVWNKMHGK